MRYSEIKIVESILLEYKRDVTANKMGNKILQTLQKDSSFTDTNMDDSQKIDAVLEQLEEMDPTPNKNYVQWLAKQYTLGQFRLGDKTSVSEILKDFIRTPIKRDFKRRGLTSDINQYDYSTLRREVIQSARGGMDPEQVEDPEENLDYEHIGDMKVLHSSPQGQLIVPTSEDASCELGQGTKWCTAYDGEDRDRNRFKNYTRGGNLYIWIDGETGEKYQFHFQSDQYHDKDNEGVPRSKLKKLILSRPVLKDFFEKNAPAEFKVEYIGSQPEDVQLEAVEKDGLNLRYIIQSDGLPSLKVQIAAVEENPAIINDIENPKEEVKLAALRTIANVSDSESMDFDDLHAEALKMDVNLAASVQRPSDAAITKAAKRTPTIIEDVLDFGVTPSEEALIAAVSQYGSMIRRLYQLNLDITENVQIAAVKDDYEALRMIISEDDTPSEKVQLAAVENDPRAMKFLLDADIEPSVNVQLAAVSNDEVDPSVIRKVIQDLEDRDIEISDKVMNTAKETITKYD